MSTRSTIAVQHADDSFSQVYCHWDGYLEHVGNMLVDHFDTIEKVENLIARGYISSIDYDSESKDCTVERILDRSYPDVFLDLEDFEKNRKLEEFNYLFANGRWECLNHEGFIPDVAAWLKSDA